MAADLGASGASLNPALIGAGGWQLETGLLDLNGLGGPYFACAGGSGRRAYALEYFTDHLDGKFFQGGLGAFSALLWKGGPWAGAAVRGETLGEKIGVDADLGLSWLMGTWRGGTAFRRVLESGAGIDSAAASSSRVWQTGMAWEPAGTPFVKPALRYEFLSREFSPLDVDHLGSAGFFFMPERALGLDISGRIPQRNPEAWGWGAGLTTRFRILKAAAECRYAFAYRAPNRPKTGLSQAVSIQIHWRALRDRLPPVVRVSVEAPVWFPGFASKPESFFLGVDDNLHQPKAWKLSVHRALRDGRAGAVVREFSGDGLPPLAIQWKGEDARDIPLQAGLYVYRLWAEDTDGNSAVTPWRMLEIAGAASQPADPPKPSSPDSSQTRDPAVNLDSSEAGDPFSDH